ncbi:hypothetical protein H2200_004987 [Cladophialophora chaetospira]|uniref:BTB domain-containing protein n=1 Tax=Cladophialophora chaetospira TaxID=386627 RepID=A0AA38XB40_9EURO|nr:hypothetical protein H2200_004987 [Cladophialophora chaetospira]
MADQGDSPVVASSSAPGKRKADEIEAPAMQAPTKMLEIVPDADVTFNVGTGKDALQIKVSGAALGWASPVFKTLLSSQFIEAQTKTIESELSTLKDLNLPDTDPQVFIQFCNIIHHRPVKLDELTGGQVADLALLGDMRQAFHTLQPWIEIRCKSIRSSLSRKIGFYPSKFIDFSSDPPMVAENETRFSAADLIELSALCSWGNTFEYATRHYMAHYPTEIGADNRETHSLPSIMNKYGDSIYGQYSTCSYTGEPTVNCGLDVIAQSYKEYIDSFLTDVYSCINEEIGLARHWNDRETCKAAKYGMLHILLRDHGITPMNSGEPRSLVATLGVVSKVVEVLRSYRNVEMTKPCSRTTKRNNAGGGTRKPCEYCERKFADDLDYIVSRHSRRLPGVCLSCFRAGKDDVFVDRPAIGYRRHKCGDE